jgi:hypothetical protein
MSRASIFVLVFLAFAQPARAQVPGHVFIPGQTSSSPRPLIDCGDGLVARTNPCGRAECVKPTQKPAPKCKTRFEMRRNKCVCIRATE